MTDFNKGDFTQQGVDGHVNAKIRLNAKRYLDIDLTSNEEASGCTIAGHVYDSLNEITYPIGSAPSGNIEITENTAEGEPLDVSQYATATVNVAGGGGAVPIKSIDNVSILSVGMNGQYVLPLNLTSNNELPGFSNLLVTVDNETFILYPSISNNNVLYNPAQYSDYSAILSYQSTAPAGFKWYLSTSDETPTEHTVSVEILNPETAVLLSGSQEVPSVPVDKYNNAWEVQLDPNVTITTQVYCNFDNETGLVTLNRRYATIASGIV